MPSLQIVTKAKTWDLHNNNQNMQYEGEKNPNLGCVCMVCACFPLLLNVSVVVKASVWAAVLWNQIFIYFGSFVEKHNTETETKTAGKPVQK